MSLHFFLVAGESSGDRLGSQLMSGIKSIDNNVKFSGVGGPEMIAAGLTSLFDYQELSVMGIAEVLPRLPDLLTKIRMTSNSVNRSDVNAVITIDSPDFTFRVARRIRAKRPELPIIHYVSPSIWAWRARRVKKLQKIFDLVLTLLPFEPKILQDSGVNAAFVGHPAVEISPIYAVEEQEIRHKLKIGIDDPVLLVLPGSRYSEIKRLAPTFGQVAEQFINQHPRYKVVVPVANNVLDAVKYETNQWKSKPILYFSKSQNFTHSHRTKAVLFQTANVALAASGTVTLELAASRTPTIAAYDVHPLSRFLIAKLLKIDAVTLPNIVFGQKVIPEYLGSQCQPKPILKELEKICSDSAERNAQIQAFDEIVQRLQSPNNKSGDFAAATIFKNLEHKLGNKSGPK